MTTHGILGIHISHGTHRLGITDPCTLHITGDILLGTITDGTTILGTTGLGIMGSHGAGAGVALGAVSR